MSYEEDYLMGQNRELKQRVDLLEQVLEGAGMLVECPKCTAKYPPDLEKCPQCGHITGEPEEEVAGPAVEDGTQLEKPAVNDSKEAWQRYAGQQGVLGWESMTKDQLIEAVR